MEGPSFHPPHGSTASTSGREVERARQRSMGSDPRIVEDCFGFLQLYTDGSVTRSAQFNAAGPPVPGGEDGGVLWKDCSYDTANGLYLRLYRPAPSSSSTEGPLPILYFLHGGGFCFGSRTWPNYHAFCLRLASLVGAVVISPDHRLAPEHRLPAAVEDVFRSVRWLRAQAVRHRGGRRGEPWLGDGAADFGRVFIIGDSSGGNIAHHLALRIGSDSFLDPVLVRGYVLLAPFFGGNVRTRSELGPPESKLSLVLLDQFWRLALPEGESVEHPLANPWWDGGEGVEGAAVGPMVVVVGERELLRDRVREYAARLQGMGKAVEYREFGDQEHDFFLDHPTSDAAVALLALIRHFLSCHT